MTKRKIRCYKKFANVFQGVYNYLVYCLVQDGWSAFSLVTCIKCGEIFVIDLENPKTFEKSINEIASTNTCPNCNSFLRDTLSKYPKSIKLPNGKIGSFIPQNIIPKDEDTFLIEFYEIIP